METKSKAQILPQAQHCLLPCCQVVQSERVGERASIPLPCTITQTEPYRKPSMPLFPPNWKNWTHPLVATATATPTKHTLVIMIGAATTTAGLGLALYVSLQAYQQGGLFAWHPFCMSMGAIGLSTATVQAVRSRRTVEGIQSKTQRVQVLNDMRGKSTSYSSASCVSV